LYGEPIDGEPPNGIAVDPQIALASPEPPIGGFFIAKKAGTQKWMTLHVPGNKTDAHLASTKCKH
jgi:hypothetical protein